MRNLTETFSVYFTGLRAALAPTVPVSQAHIAFIGMVWRYILGLSGRIDRLVARWKNGTLPKPRAARPARTRKPRAAPQFRLPRSRNWLPRRLPGTGIGVFGGQLQHLFATDQEFAAFLEAAPQARRMLTPLCRMFGVALPAMPAAAPPTAAPPAAPVAAPSDPSQNSPQPAAASAAPPGRKPVAPATPVREHATAPPVRYPCSTA
jgi:hypothetical protein